MFGLKLVNKKKYLKLEKELSELHELLTEKNTLIDELKKKVEELELKIELLSTPMKKHPSKNVELLTDVTDVPLGVENKATSKRKKIVRKTE